MFDELNDTKNVIIVKGNGKGAKYAQMLFQMIGKFPNIKVGQPMTENEYNNNLAGTDQSSNGTTPNGKIIFFGNGKEAKTQGRAVKWKFERYGMRYGWTGNRCVITASANEIPLSQLKEFADYYNSRLKKYLSLLDNAKFSELKYSNFEQFMNDLLDYNNKLNEKIGFTDKTAATGMVLFVNPIISLALGAKALYDATSGTVAAFERNDIQKRQYELLVCEFMLNGFEAFMNNASRKKAKRKAIIVYGDKDAAYAHSLYNLMQQYGGYEVGEYTEKKFIDNAKQLESENRIIFLGETKSSKERWLDIYRYIFDENGMRYGWQGSHAFVNIRTLKKNEMEVFLKKYEQKRKEFEDEAKAYSKGTHSEKIKKTNTALTILDTATTFAAGPIFAIPKVLIGSFIRKKAGDAIDNAITAKNLKQYQYALLCREFVLNGLKKFMEEK